MYVMNIEAHLRGQVDSFLVVQLIRSKDICEFGLEKCFERLVQDVDELVKNGIDLSIGDSYPIRVGQYRADKKGDLHLTPLILFNFQGFQWA